MPRFRCSRSSGTSNKKGVCIPELLTPRKKVVFFSSDPLGPRGTGKSTWTRAHFPKALRFDLLDQSLFQELLRNPARFEERVRAQNFSGIEQTVVIDEIQRLPELLNGVHRLIEDTGLRFVLTGSSARKLRKQGTNLLAGRARLRTMHPLTAKELGCDFDLQKTLRVGNLPCAYTSSDPKDYLASYVGVYLREEVQQEALVRNLARFTDFLEVAAFSQGTVLSVQAVARECGVDRKTAENYFGLLEDLLLACRIPVFRRKAKRCTTQQPKFYYFDVGVYRTLRRQGPLDNAEEIDGPAVETLVLQELRATIANLHLDLELFFWRTASKHEVDFVIYGPAGLIAIEVKRSDRLRDKDLQSLRLFGKDYPQATTYVFYGGDQRYQIGEIEVIPLTQALPQLDNLLILS